MDYAAGLFPARDGWKGEEGPRPRIRIAPGLVGISGPNLARYEKTHERHQLDQAPETEEGKVSLQTQLELAEDRPSKQRITEFTRKSVRNMVKAFCELDYQPMLADATRIAAMTTLTYSGDWETVAPNGKTVKKHLERLRERYRRAWGQDLLAIWKLEFQRRGAPHVHMLMVPPHGLALEQAAGAGRRRVGAGKPFRQWLSENWADIVNHPDLDEKARHLLAGTAVDFAEGLKASDPKRVAVYFTKHAMTSDKAYQHIVPEAWQEEGQGPGRFWGYWGLRRVAAEVELDPQVATELARMMRRWARAQGTTRQVAVPRHQGGRAISQTHDVIGLAGLPYVEPQHSRRRKVRRRVNRLSNGRGWISVNDGPAFGSALARHLLGAEDETTQDRRSRLVAATGSRLDQPGPEGRTSPGTRTGHQSEAGRRPAGQSPPS